MVEFLNKDAAYSEIVKIVIQADNMLVLISPYIKIPADFLERLKHRDKQGLQTVIVCREKDLKPDERDALRQLKHLDLRFDDALHAKCFHSEKSMVITSLNLHQHSQQNNREMGILLRATSEDLSVFNEALMEANFIVSHAKKDSLMKGFVNKIMKEAKAIIEEPPTMEPSRTRTQSRARATSGIKQEGHCIRCNKSIPYDLDKPYCLPCARVWNSFGGNGDYKEKYCHQCGKRISTTFNYPRCNSCYRGN
ncbi:hypothetical protein ACFLXJ_05395 [Chloroflexota bacterium]